MMSKLYALIMLTFKEGVRDRAIFGIGLFSLLLMGFSMIVVSFFMRELNKVAVDINLSAIGFAGLLLTFFVSVNLMAKDIDRHTVYCVLSKPYSRAQYIWGKYLGIMLIIMASFCILTLCSSVTLYLIKIQYANWFIGFSWLEFYKAIYSNLLMFFILNAVVIFFSSITSSSFITLLFSISIYIGGQTIEEVVRYLKTGPSEEIMLSEGVRRIIDIIQYVLPNLSVFDLKVQASHAIVVSWGYLFAITIYAVVYSCILILAGALIFHKRELTLSKSL